MRLAVGTSLAAAAAVPIRSDAGPEDEGLEGWRQGNSSKYLILTKKLIAFKIKTDT